MGIRQKLGHVNGVGLVLLRGVESIWSTTTVIWFPTSAKTPPRIEERMQASDVHTDSVPCSSVAEIFAKGTLCGSRHS